MRAPSVTVTSVSLTQLMLPGPFSQLLKTSQTLGFCRENVASVSCKVRLKIKPNLPPVQIIKFTEFKKQKQPSHPPTSPWFWCDKSKRNSGWSEWITRAIIILVIQSADEQKFVKKKRETGKQSGAIVWSADINSTGHYIKAGDNIHWWAAQ